MNECVDPLELEEGDLIAYADQEEPIDDQTGAKVRAHLDRCPHCAAQVKDLRRTAAILRATLYRHSCPPPEQLGLYQLGLLSARERLSMARHVRECPHCMRDLEQLACLEGKPSLLERLRQRIQVVEAIFLPPLRAQAAPLRGDSPLPQRFHTAELDVLISVQPGHSLGCRTVNGRLFSREGAALPDLDQEVWLMRGQEAWAAPIEPGGTFAFAEVEPGTYAIGLEWNGQAVLIQEVTVA